MIDPYTRDMAHRKRWRLETTAKAIVLDLLTDADILVIADEIIGKYITNDEGLAVCRDMLAIAAKRAGKT